MEVNKEVREYHMDTYTKQNMKDQIKELNMLIKSQQELQTLVTMARKLNLNKDLIEMGEKLFVNDIMALAQNRMALELMLTEVILRVEIGKLKIEDLHYEIDEIPCPGGAGHNHKLIKLWIEDQKTVIIDMVSKDKSTYAKG
jgi:hypothetical protein